MTTHRWFFIGVVLVTLSALSVMAQVSVVGELSHDINVKPGDTYEGTVVLRNETNEPQEAKVYQTDYTFRSDGTNNYGEPGSTPRSNAKWITFSPSYVVIPPQGTTNVNYSVTVPQDTAPGAKKFIGTYWSMLMVEGIAKGSRESSIPSGTKKPQMGIVQTIRYGIQIATHFTNTGVKNIVFRDVKIVSNKPGERFLQFDIENTGDIGFHPEIYVEFFDAKGISVGKYPGIAYRIYPGTSARETIDIAKVPHGTYKAMIVVDAGGDDIFGAQHTLKF